MSSLERGARGEEAAARYLQSKGYQIVARNYRKPCGEIDIIARKGDMLLFVEVKARAYNSFGGPLAAVTAAKQRKIAQTAQYFIKETNPKFDSIRFDVIGLLGEEITHIENAFLPQRTTL